MKNFDEFYRTSCQKRMEKRKLSNNILIFVEKHGRRYFDASTKEKLEKACLKVLKQRYDEDWYFVRNETNTFGMTEEQIEALPEGIAKDKCKKLYQEYQENNEALNQEKTMIKRIETAIEEKEGAYAFELLYSRNDYEYERMELVELEKE